MKTKVIGTSEDKFVDIFIYIFLALIFIVTLYPFLNVLAISLNNAMDAMRGGIYFWPREFSLYTYKELLKDHKLYGAAFVSFERTILSLIANLFCTVITAYLLSRKDFVLRKFMNIMLLVTIYVSSGLVPGYILMQKLHLVGNFWIYIIPGFIDVFNILITRTYIESLPDSFIESAKLDGAGEMTILFRIIVPLITPVLAVVAIFIAISSWNSWFDTYLYGNGKQSMMTLQYMLMQKLSSVQMDFSNVSGGQAAANAASNANHGSIVTPESTRAAMTIIIALPIVLVYPFFQRFFVSGMTLGGVKG